MLINVYIKNGSLMIGEENGLGLLPYLTSEISITDEILKEYEIKENSSNNKQYIKNAIKLKEAGFTADEIIELIGSK